MKKTTTTKSKQATEFVTTINGHSLKVFSDDLITQRIKKQGIYEKLPLDLISKILQNIDRAIVLDVGAHIGNHSLSFAMHSHHVYSFEPVNSTFELLQDNSRRNQLSNITCYNFGLSDKNTSQNIFINENGNIGASSLKCKSDTHSAEWIDLIQGDEWATTHLNNLDGIDFVKIDVEGHEPKVLQGLKHTILKHRPIIMLEYNEHSSIQEFKEQNTFNSFFYDYDVFAISNNYDLAYHNGKKFPAIRRFLARKFTKKTAKLYPFHATRLYDNILIVPKEKLSALPSGVTLPSTWRDSCFS